MRRCAAAILYVEILAVTLLSQTSSRPVPAELDNSRDKRSSSAATDNFFEMSGISIITGNPSATGCKVVEQVKRNQTVWKVSANRTLQSSLQEVTQYVTKCCPGWNGTECNIAPPTTRPPSPTATTTRPPRPTATTTATALDPSNPCANLTCAGVDDAMCAVVTKCGRQIPLFVDSAGQLVDCPNSPTNINEITCCQNDPCAGNVSCSQHPEAVCFTTECCRPLWLLPSGVEVNCLLVDKRDTTADSGFSQ